MTYVDLIVLALVGLAYAVWLWAVGRLFLSRIDVIPEWAATVGFAIGTLIAGGLMWAQIGG